MSDDKISHSIIAARLTTGEPVGMSDGGTYVVRTPSQKDLITALDAAYARGMADAREIASGKFGWDVKVWLDMTKKDMTRLMAEAIVAAIDARLSAIK